MVYDESGFSSVFCVHDLHPYLVFRKFDQGDDLLYACSTVAVLIMELIKMKIGFDANEQNN